MFKYGAQRGPFGSDLREAVALAKEYGCEGFEMGMPVGKIRTGDMSREDVLKQAEEQAQILKETDFEAISVSPGILLKHVEAPECIETACEAANIMGTRNIRMFFSPHVRLGGPGSTLTEWTAEYDGTKSYWDWYETDLERLGVFVDFARKYDVRFVFELHHGYATNSPSAMRRIMDSYSPRYVGAIVDPGNMVFEGNEGWRNGMQILGDYIGYFHCKNAKRAQDENGNWTHCWATLMDGVANYPEIVTALKDIGFEGYLCIEDLRRDVSAEEKVKVAIDYLKGLEASDERVMPT